MVVGEVLNGLLGSLGHLLATIADVDAPQARATVDQFATLMVLDAHPTRLGDNVGSLLQVIHNRGIRMEHGLAINVFQRVVASGPIHVASFRHCEVSWV